MRVDEFEAAELAARVLGKPEPEEDSDLEAIEEAFIDEYGLDMVQFAGLVEKLLPLCAEGVSPLSGTRYRGFAADSVWIVKQEATG